MTTSIKPKLLLCSSKYNSTLPTKINQTKIMKIDFTEETEEEMLFQPRYRFGLSEYDIILLRIYVYTAIAMHLLSIYLEKIKK